MRMTIFAAVLDAGVTAASENEGRRIQGLLIEALGYHLRSVRLAAPFHFAAACESALAERPDCLIVAGQRHAFRLAASILHKGGHAVPVIFLPTLHRAEWARHLWGDLPAEALAHALAAGDMAKVPLDVGSIGGELFLGTASGGLVPCIQEMARNEARAAGFAEVQRLGHCIGHPRVRVSCAGRLRPKTLGLSVTLNRPGAGPMGVTPLHGGHALRVHMLRSSGWHWRLFAGMAAGADWTRHKTVQNFVCSRVRAEGTGTQWFMLDGDPVAVRGAADFTVLAGAVQSFVLGISVRRVANDNAGQARNASPGAIVSYARSREPSGRSKRMEKKR